jgi:hypothetical protein
MANSEKEQLIVNPSAENLAAAAKAAGKKGPPPVHLWDPPFHGDIDMEIRRDGTWFYLGTPINRHGLVKLFSSIIRKDGDDYFLVTPVEKVGIRVVDAPFVAVDANATGAGREQGITFTTNVEDEVTAGPDHPIRVVRDPESGEPAPYILIRRNLEALIDRKTFYRLIELGAHEDCDGQSWFGLWSGGSFFPVIPSSELG